MTPSPENRPAAGQPPLAELMARFLGRQSAAAAAGMAAVLARRRRTARSGPGSGGRSEAGVGRSHGRDCLNSAIRRKRMKAPADWPTLVAAQPSHTGLAFAAGNFPQMVRDLVPLYRAADESRATLPIRRRPAGRRSRVAAVVTNFRRRCSSSEHCDLARQWDAAEALLNDGTVPAKWTAAWANESRGDVCGIVGRRPRPLRRWREHAGERAGPVQPRHGGAVHRPAG